MKKITTTVILCLVLAQYLNAQNPYYDALILDTLSRKTFINGKWVFSKNDSAILAQVLKKYVPGGKNYSDIQSTFETNPFFKLARITSQSTTSPFNISGIASSFKAASSIGGLNVTTAVEGISQFMIKRAKEELTIAFFERFKKCVEAHPEIQVMFPTTTKTLNNLLSYQYPEMLPALQKAFYDDLKLLPIHLDDVLELPKYRELLVNFPEVRIAIHFIRVCSQLETEDNHPFKIIDEVAGLPEWEDTTASVILRNMGNSIRLGDILSKSLSTDLPHHTWISSNDLKKLTLKKSALEIYLGLIYQQVTHIKQFFPDAVSNEIEFTRKNGSQISFGKIMEANKDNLILFQTKLSEFIQLTEKLQETMNDITGNEIQNPDIYYRYITNGIDVIEYAFGIVRIFDDEFIKDDYVKIARSCNDLYRNIYIKEYNAAILNAVNILKDVQNIVGQNTTAIQKVNNGLNLTVKGIDTTKLKNKEVIKIIADSRAGRPISEKSLKKLQKKLDEIPKLTDEQKRIILAGPFEATTVNLFNVIPDITKYGLFIANIAAADTPDEVEKIIEAAVLPVGSSSIKKNSHWNISIQSYLGAYWRTSGNATGTVERAWDDKFGVIAPIGLSFSYGFEKWGAVSLFVPLLDLGAMVDYQLKYDSITPQDVQVSKNYEIELGQIFSPGGYIVYGFGANLPLSLGVGGQYGPGLGNIDPQGNAVVDNPHWRWNIFLAVDIPLFNIFNRERKTSLLKK